MLARVVALLVLALSTTAAQAQSLPPLPGLPTLPPPPVSQGFVRAQDLEAMERRALIAERDLIEALAAIRQLELQRFEQAYRAKAAELAEKTR